VTIRQVDVRLIFVMPFLFGIMKNDNIKRVHVAMMKHLSHGLSWRWAVLGAAGCLVACATDPGSASTAAESATTQFPALIDDRLGRAAERSATALETLAMIERTRTPPSPVRVDEALLSPELRQPITIGWAGPANEAVRRIAETVGYRYVESGARPSAPVLIALDARERAAGQILSDIGLRVQGAASVIVNQRARLVEYRHGVVATASPRPRPATTASAPRSPASAASAARATSSMPGGGATGRPAHCPPCEGAVQAEGGGR
jgi:defect-in-organelle-trafficking protein DotD